MNRLAVGEQGTGDARVDAAAAHLNERWPPTFISPTTAAGGGCQNRVKAVAFRRRRAAVRSS